MYRISALVLLGLLAAPAQAQVDPEPEVNNLYAGASETEGVVRVGVTHQRYSIEFTSGATRALSQTSVPLYVAVPVGRGVGVSLRAIYASGGGDDLDRVSGVADAQLGLSYRQQLGEAEAVFSLGVGLPLGSGALSTEQLATAVLFSRNEFAFEAPTLRQGLRFAPGVTIAVPVDEHLALGVAVAYQVRSAFSPFDDLDLSYAPANELLLAGGLDLRLGRASFVSADVSYALYGTDTFGERSLEPGNRLTAALRVQGGIGRQEIHFLTRYRHRGKGDVGGSALEPLVADELAAQLGALIRFADAGALGIAFGARYLGDFGELGEATQSVDDALAIADHQLLFDLGLAPSVRIAQQVRLLTAFTYSLGLGTFVDLADVTPLRGFRASGGVEVRF
jgi:hypothetical protein